MDPRILILFPIVHTWIFSALGSYIGGNINYLGCWNDGASDSTKVLQKRGHTYYNWLLEDCLGVCLRHDSFYFGLSHDCMCYCGNLTSNYMQYGPSTSCSNKCLNDGNDMIRVYEARCHADLIENGMLIWSYGEVQFQCNSGFYLSGRKSLRCLYQSNALTLDGEPPICLRAPTTPRHSSAYHTSTGAPSTIQRRTSTNHQSTFAVDDQAHETEKIGSTRTTTSYREKENTSTIETISASVVGETTATETSSKESQTQNVAYTTTATIPDPDLSTKSKKSKNEKGEAGFAQNTSTENHDIDDIKPSENNIAQSGSDPLLNILLALIPFLVLTFLIGLGQCYRYQSPIPSKRRSMGDSVCGPSSFEYLAPRAVTRQFSVGVVEMTYNRTLDRYRSKDDLDDPYEIMDDCDVSFGNRSSCGMDEVVYV